MPLKTPQIEDYIILKGRAGIEYHETNGQVYFIDSEMVVSKEYDVALYIDGIVFLNNKKSQPDIKTRRIVINRVEKLCTEKGIKTRIFYDNE